MKKRELISVLVIASAMLWPDLAWSKNEALKGLAVLRPFVARISDGGQSCGLDGDKLKEAVEASIGLSGMKTSDEAVVYFYVNVTTVHLPVQDFCVSGVSIDVYTRQYIDLAVTQANVPATITLWESGSLFGGPRVEHADQVLDVLQTRADAFVKDWSDAQ
jgi:hypothetical protein